MKLLRITTVPSTMLVFCKGLFKELQETDGYEVVVVSSPGEALNEIAANENVRTIEVPMERRISPLKDLVSLWRMLRVILREKPDIVHSMTPKAGLISMMAAWLARVPVRIHTFTGLVFPTSSGLKRRILKTTDWLTCACATHIIPEGEGVKNDLLNNGITKKPLRVLGYGNIRGIDLDYFKRTDNIARIENPGAKSEYDKHIFTFLFVGRIVSEKGINELIAAFTRLNEERPGKVKLVLVGPFEDDIDPVSGDTRLMIDKCEAIEAVGEQRDVRPFYETADALVLPSYREGFPNVVIEAGAMGLPSIVTDINGSREIIIEGKNGTIVQPRDEDALYNAMRDWTDNPVKVAQMATEARPLVANRYEQRFVRQCLKEFYCETISVMGQSTKDK